MLPKKSLFQLASGFTRNKYNHATVKLAKFTYVAEV